MSSYLVPRPLGQLLGRLPQQPPALLLVAALNLALGRILDRDALQPLVGRRLCIRVKDAGLALAFTLTQDGFRPSAGGAPFDLTISATAQDYALLALRREDPDTLFFSRRLLMEGDTELGLLVKNTLDAVELPRLSEFSPAALLERLRARATALLP